MKRTSMFKMVAGIALAMVLCFTMVLPALAVDYSKGENSEEPAMAAITKVFRMPINTPTPVAKFVFKFDKVGMNTPPDITNLDKMPAIPNVTIEYGGQSGAGIINIVGGDKLDIKQSGNFLVDSTGALLIGDVWGNGEGVYKYQVYENLENPDKSSITSNPDVTNNDEEFSKAVYDIEVWVEKDEDGVLFPKYVVVIIVEGKEDEYYKNIGENELPENGKVDPTPGGPGGEDEDKPDIEKTIEEDFSQVIFTNKYWQSDGPGDEDPDSNALEIVKKITGNGADQYMESEFEFKVNVIQPSIIKEEQTYKAWVMDTNGDNVTDVNNSSLMTDEFIVFTSNIARTITLLPNEKLVFIDLHIGSIVEVEEKGDSSFVPTYQRTFPDTTVGKQAYTGTLGESWGFPRNTGSNLDKGPHYTIAGANKNTVTFTNTVKNALPTGISVNDLPYIILISVVVLALAGYLAFKIRSVKKSMV